MVQGAKFNFIKIIIQTDVTKRVRYPESVENLRQTTRRNKGEDSVLKTLLAGGQYLSEPHKLI